MKGNRADMQNLSPALPTVSVIIPLYNAESFIAEAIESVLGQTRPPQQVIIVDDGSTDGSADVARRYGQHIELVQQPNAGGASARPRALGRGQQGRDRSPARHEDCGGGVTMLLAKTRHAAALMLLVRV